MTPELGENTIFYIEVLTANGLEMMPICAITDFGIDLTNDTVETTPTSRWKDRINGFYDYSVSISGIVKIPKSDISDRLLAITDGRLISLIDGQNIILKGFTLGDWEEYGFYDLLTIFTRFKYLNWLNFSSYSNAVFGGQACISNLSYNSNNGDVSKWSGTLQGKGPIQFSAIKAPVVSNVSKPVLITHTDPLTWTSSVTAGGLYNFQLSGTPLVGDVATITVDIKNASIPSVTGVKLSYTVKQGDSIGTILSALSSLVNGQLADQNTGLLYSSSISGSTLTVDPTNGTTNLLAASISLADMMSFTVTLTPYLGANNYTSRVIGDDISYNTQTSNIFSFTLPNRDYSISFNVSINRFDSSYTDNILIYKI